MQILCFTSDKHLAALPAFIYLHDKYWSDPVDFVGFTPPDFEIPDPHKFHSIGKFEDYPIEKWSNAARLAVETIVTEEAFIYTMEDFWLVRRVNDKQIGRLFQLMNITQKNPPIVRIDLTTDRLYAPNVKNVGYLGEIDLITNEKPVAYSLSLQAGIWRKDAFLKHVIDNETPHDTEIIGSARINNDPDALVLGTRQAPMRYIIAIQFGKLALDGGYQVPKPIFNDLAELQEKGLLNELLRAFTP